MTNEIFQLLESEISKICSQWRGQVISYIKEKDRLLNPNLYNEDYTPDKSLNPNLFDDEFDDEDNLNSSSSSSTDEDPDSFVLPDRNLSLENTSHSANLFDSSHEQSNVEQNAQPTPNSKARNRENEIDAELDKYLDYDKHEFQALCLSRGLTREDPSKYYSIGAITWEYWRINKNRYPIIYAAIKPILQAPTSSSAIERLFSKISGFVTHQKNSFKSKNLLALIQISQMDDYKRIAMDCFRQNKIDFTFDEASEDIENLNYDSDEYNNDPLFNFD